MISFGNCNAGTLEQCESDISVYFVIGIGPLDQSRVRVTSCCKPSCGPVLYGWKNLERLGSIPSQKQEWRLLQGDPTIQQLCQGADAMPEERKTEEPLG